MIHELAALVTNDDTIWLIHGHMGDAYVCRPKYIQSPEGSTVIFGQRYSRLHSPIFSDNRQIFGKFQDYPKYDPSGVFRNLYVLPESAAKKIITVDRNCCRCTLLNARAARFIKAIHEVCGIDQEGVGTVGSIMLGSDVPGYSDINLIIMGSRNNQKYAERADCIPGIHFRNKNEWRKFYRDFCVQGVSEEEFAEKSKDVRLQGVYDGTRFTIFPVYEELPQYRKMEESSKYVEITGIFEGNSEILGHFPMFGRIKTDKAEYEAEIWDRFLCSTLVSGDCVAACGYLNGNRIILFPEAVNDWNKLCSNKIGGNKDAGQNY